MMWRRRKLDAGNFPSWEERIDYQLQCAFDRCDGLRATDRDLHVKVAKLEHGAREEARISFREIEQLRRGIRQCWAVIAVLVGVVSALILALVLQVAS